LRFFKYVFIFLTILLTSCTADKNGLTNEFIESVPHPDSTRILYEEYNAKEKFVIFEDKTGIRYGYFSMTSDYWLHTGNIDPNPKSGGAWGMHNAPNIPVVIFCGVITDSSVQQVIVKQKTLEKNAKIIKLNGDTRKVWFVNFNILEKPGNGEPDPLKIEAYDKDGNIVWKDGVYTE
jgi:hypothetical protein